MGKRKIVFQSVDSPRRDLEWRLYLASKLAKRGISSIVGPARTIRFMQQFSKDCYYVGRLNSNTARSKGDKEYFKRFEKNNTALFYIHDEGGFFQSRLYKLSTRRVYPEEYFSNKAFKKVFFWGNAQAKYFDGHEHSDKFVISGCPRFDLSRSKFSILDKRIIKEYQDKHGDYVLICTRFGAVNKVYDDPPFLGQRSYDIRVEGGELDEYSNEEVIMNLFNYWKKISQEFSQYMPVIAKLVMYNPNIKFVVRPHPAERKSFYDDAFSLFSNVTVSKDGDVRSLIRAAKLVIHSECSTGLEALLSEKKSINYKPKGVDANGFSVAGLSKLEPIVTDFEELNTKLHELLKDEYRPDFSYDEIKHYLQNTPDNKEASDVIVDTVDEYSKNISAESKIDMFSVYISYYKYRIKTYLRGVKRSPSSIFMFRTKKNIGESKYYKHSNEYIENLWKEFGGNPKHISYALDTIVVNADV